MGHIAWGVISELPIFVSQCSNAFLLIIRLNIFANQLTSVCTMDSWFLSTLFLAPASVLTNDKYRGDRCLGQKEQSDNLYAEAIENIKPRRYICFFPRVQFDSWWY
jgi:hypothetical protein